MQMRRAQQLSISVLLIVFYLVALCHADFAIDFAKPVDAASVGSKFFFLLSNTTSPPTFATPFGVSGGYLNLTREREQTAHAMWYRHMQFVDDGFNFTFQFRIPDRSNQSGDGLAFVIQPATMGPFDQYLLNPADYCPIGASPPGCLPNPPEEYARQNNEPLAVGAPGAGIGYAGIAESLAVEFDMWKDLDNADPDDNHISLHTNGAASNNAEERSPVAGGTQIGVALNIGVPGTGPMWNGKLHTVRIEYKRLQTSGDLAGMCPIRVFYDPVDAKSTPVAQAVCGPDPVGGEKRLCKCLSSMLPSINKLSRGELKGYAWIGLTAATGGNVQTHQIANLAFSGSPKVKEIRPWAGPIEGGTVMSIIGDNFRARPGARCIFGDVVTALTFKDSETAVCTSPPSKLKIRHMVNLTIMFSEDDIANLQPGFLCPEFTQPTPSNRCTPYQRRVDRFYYYINPTVTKVTPHSGPVTGGTAITLEGTGFYPELFSISSCYFGSSTFQSALPNQLGPLPLAPNVTNYITTLTQVVCTVTKPADIGLKNMYFSMNSQQSAVISPIPGYKDKKTQRFPMLSTGFFFYPTPRLDGIMPSGTSSDQPEERTVTIYGNFTITDDMRCTFDTTSVDAQYFKFDESKIKMYDATDRLQCDAPNHAWSYSVPFRLSLNGQQQLPNSLEFRYDATFTFLLMAGSVGLMGLVILGCCSFTAFQVYNMADYRTLLSPEYLELTGKTRWRVIKDILSARGSSERKELVKVLDKLKLVKQKNSQFGSSKWANAAKRALEVEKGSKAKTGWDLLLGGSEQSAGDGAAAARVVPAQSQEKKGKTGWTSIVKNTEEGAGARARSTTATAAASKWAAAASAKDA